MDGQKALREQVRGLEQYIDALKQRAGAAENTVRYQDKSMKAAAVGYVDDLSDVLVDLSGFDEDAEDEPSESGRVDPRAGLMIGVRLRWGVTNMVAISENISRSGLRLMLTNAPKEGQGVALELKIPKMPQIHCRGRVRWIRPGMEGGLTGCGIEFVDLDHATANAIQRYAEAILAGGKTLNFEPS